MLQVEGARAGYDGLDVLRDVSMTVGDGAIVALIGANGAGKSTLLRVISGRLPLRAGSVVLDGTELSATTPHVRANAGICHIAEGGGLFRSLTVLENLRLFGLGADAEDIDRILHVFPRLATLLSRTAGTLSGGEQQMVALSRAWAREPRVVLIDELSLGLAEELVDELMPVVAALPERGVSVLLVEQHVRRALAIASEAVLLQRGSVIFAGPRDAVDSRDLERCLLGVGDQAATGA